MQPYQDYQAQSSIWSLVKMPGMQRLIENNLNYLLCILFHVILYFIFLPNMRIRHVNLVTTSSMSHLKHLVAIQKSLTPSPIFTLPKTAWIHEISSFVLYLIQNMVV